MATIPMGEFSEARVVPRTNPSRVDLRGNNVIGDAVADLGQTMVRVGAGMSQQQADDHARERAEAEALARAKAQNALFDDEVQQRAKLTELQSRIADASLPYGEAQEEYQTWLSQREATAIADLDAVGQENYQRGLQRNRFAITSELDNVVKGARRADFKGQIDAIRDHLGKMASDPNADLDRIVQGGAELQPLAQQAGIGGTFGKDHQNFTDRLYKDNANARLVAARDDMQGLRALEADLTTEGGRYYGKLDASATNTLLAGVQSRIAQLETRAEVDSRKGEAAAERALTAFERQIATGIGAPVDTVNAWTETMRLGTPDQQARYQELLQSEVEVRRIMTLPPVQQRTALAAMEAKQAIDGATVQDQANTNRLRTAVESNLKDLRDQPLVAYQRQTGEVVPPLDIAALASGDAAAVQGQIAARVDTLTAMREQYGAEVGNAILLPQEAQALSAALDKSGPTQAAQFFGVLSSAISDPAVYRAAMQQIAPDSPVRAYAGVIFAEQRATTLQSGGIFRGAVKAESGDVARLMLEGEALLNKSRGDKAEDGKVKFPVPPPSQFTPEIEGFVGSAFAGNSEAYEIAEQAVRAYYVGSAARAGDVSGVIDRKRVQEAVRAVLGDPIDVNGSDVFAPWGMDEGDFLDRVEAGWAQAAATLPAGFSRDFDAYRLRQVGNDAYRVIGGNGAYLHGADGNPLTLRIGRDAPAARTPHSVDLSAGRTLGRF